MRQLGRIITLFAAVAGLLLGLGVPAQAFPQAAFPLTSNGSRGTDVVALQHLLTAHGRPVTADGVFGSGTRSAVVGFQQSKGLTADGIVGPATWEALAITVRQGDNGPAVQALQSLLNAKRGAGLGVDGAFGSATHAAVSTFQSHAGVGVDGVVGTTTWKNLLWHYENIGFGAGTMCAQSPDGNADAHWATAGAVGQLAAAAAGFASTGNGRLPVGDAGFEHGGDILGHASHEVGTDIDVWPIRTDSAQCTAGRITWQSSAYDRAATRLLVQEIRAKAPGHVELIFFNDPQLISEGLTTSYPNHDNHLHIRYR
ncbi:penicillin-insensitive murein endopeptidase [Streptomyces formicae]|uniref:Penicillin-insensitive murein endopeptidase n=1 Tax=Streptomyces formicae TaxID=1616117 RepID=A0ABY3WLZ5_9ACTN|nr:penicillin-insensitive murein endopeptidase [Streptomyces formicae]UNM12489.1 penicillin-insensitive murein endopeptidase [Streptomyces formicae]